MNRALSPERLLLRTGLGGYGVYSSGNAMTWRPVSCFAASILMHAIVLIIPIALMTIPFHGLAPKDDVLEVNLVGASMLDKEPVHAETPAAAQVGRQVKPQAVQKAIDEVKREEAPPQEAMSFVTDRKVAASYLDRLKTKIFLAWKYPDDAIQVGRQGDVSLSFVLNGNGELTRIGVVKGSGSRSLDNASIMAVRQANPFGPLPDDMSGKPLKITGHFRYVLD